MIPMKFLKYMLAALSGSIVVQVFGSGSGISIGIILAIMSLVLYWGITDAFVKKHEG